MADSTNLTSAPTSDGTGAGSDSGFTLHDERGTRFAIEGGQVRIEEARTYGLTIPGWLEAGSARPEAWLGELPLTYDPQLPGFAFSIAHWVGDSSLHVRAGKWEWSLRVQVAARAEKLSDAAWVAMLEDLERWMPGLITGFEGGLSGDVLLQGGYAPFLAMALHPLVGALVRAIQMVVEVPRELAEEYTDELPLHMARKADREALAWLGRHPEATRAVKLWFTALQGNLDISLPQQLTRDILDHPANRYLAWLILRVSRRLSDLAEALETMANHSDAQPDTGAWCRARALLLRQGALALNKILKCSFLRLLQPAPATEAALLVVRDDPRYARVHLLARRFLAPRFKLSRPEDGIAAPLRPSFDLYELWCLPAVHRALAEALPEVRWEWRPTGAGDLLGGFGNQSKFVAPLPQGGTLTLWFNLTFSSWRNSGEGRAERFSISRERRPDLVLAWQPAAGEGRWLFLDAKYRVRAEALAEAFDSIHVYRDALHWPRLGGQARGGCLLVPAEAPECSSWFTSEFRARFGAGVFRMTPGEQPSAELASWVLEKVWAPERQWTRRASVDSGAPA